MNIGEVHFTEEEYYKTLNEMKEMVAFFKNNKSIKGVYTLLKKHVPIETSQKNNQKGCIPPFTTPIFRGGRKNHFARQN